MPLCYENELYSHKIMLKLTFFDWTLEIEKNLFSTLIERKIVRQLEEFRTACLNYN